MTDTIRAPWTPEQVAALNAFQEQGGMHPFTCGGEHPFSSPTLVAHADGWQCPARHCDYRQDWAHAFMADPNAWPKSPWGERHGPTPEEVRIATRTTPDNPVASTIAADNCCGCGSPQVVYRNYRDQPFCAHCANCTCGQQPCVNAAVTNTDICGSYLPPTDPADSGCCARCGMYDWKHVSEAERLRAELARMQEAGDHHVAAAEQERDEARATAEVWRRKAIRRALDGGKARLTLEAVNDMAAEEITNRGEWGDGYRAALFEVREVLREYGQLATEEPK